MCRSPVILPPVVIRGTAAAVALAAALVGCSAEADPTPLPPLPNVSPTQVAPQLPPEANEETAEGAAAFAGYYLRIVGLAFQEADATRLQELSASGCEGCDALIAAVQTLQQEGQKRLGGDYLVRGVAAPPVEGGDVVVEISYERVAGQVVDEGGRVVASAGPVPPTNAQMRMLWRDGGWQVQGYRVVTS
jgi:hypothetical protein